MARRRLSKKGIMLVKKLWFRPRVTAAKLTSGSFTMGSRLNKCTQRRTTPKILAISRETLICAIRPVLQPLRFGGAGKTVDACAGRLDSLRHHGWPVRSADHVWLRFGKGA